jgi:putative oxidoreductase
VPPSKSAAAARNGKIAVLVSFNISNPPVRNPRVELCIRSPIGSNAKTPRATLGAGSVMISDINDVVILVARLLLATLFLIFGWRKLRDFSGTVSQLVQLGVPTPVLAAGVATFMELPVAFAIAVGAFTRPSALLMALYTLGTALIGHRYWTVKGAGYVDSMDSFYKNLGIIGGFLLLCITGAGKYSIDALYGIAAP